jgi:hypothetical protein
MDDRFALMLRAFCLFVSAVQQRALGVRGEGDY